ncbi:MAG: sigma-54-dependent Fis family transcriptional regulator [Puniceicoccaceae bacterium]|nr:MAG: sigma-54-dependent Fis family transcriptional regulator [Puniceicoccaceae bacterium]
MPAPTNMPNRRTQPARILLVEDDKNFQQLVASELQEQDHRILTASSIAEARYQLEEADARIDLILSDLRLPDGSGETLLAESRQLRPAPAFIALTAFGSIAQAVELLKAGADNFLTKPLDFEQLHICVDRALEYRQLKLEFEATRHKSPEGDFHGMIGNSPRMRTLIYEIRKVAATREPILLLGESGTGKELAARAIHAESRVSAKDFVPVNCAAIPAELIESELFGHEKGAFTGAHQKKPGLFQAAAGGSLFLDEIGELSLELQAKLLRALQEGTIRPVGASSEMTTDARIIAATHRDLRRDVDEGRFREDLFYRLEALSVELPPLRERSTDIPMLARHLLERIGRSFNQTTGDFAPEVIHAFRAYPFPGNIRELENIIKKMLVFSEPGQNLDRTSLPPQLQQMLPTQSPEARNTPEGTSRFNVDPPFPSLEQVKQRYLRHLIQQVGGNKRKAAEQAKIGRRTLYDILDRDKDSQ